MDNTFIWKVLKGLELTTAKIVDLRQRADDFFNADNELHYHWDHNYGAPSEAIHAAMLQLDAIRVSIDDVVSQNMDVKLIKLRSEIKSVYEKGARFSQSPGHDVLDHSDFLNQIEGELKNIHKHLEDELAGTSAPEPCDTVSQGGVEGAKLQIHALENELRRILEQRKAFKEEVLFPLDEITMRNSRKLLNDLNRFVASNSDASVLLDAVRAIQDEFARCDEVMRSNNSKAHTKALDAILDEVRRAYDGAVETSGEVLVWPEIKEMAGLVSVKLENANSYKEDLAVTIQDLDKCLRVEAYIAVMCLCGRVMEAALKIRFGLVEEGRREAIAAQFANKRKLSRTLDELTLGQLVELGQEFPRDLIGFLPPGLVQVASLITTFRNANAHSRPDGERAFPTADQARMVVLGVKVFLEQTLSARTKGS